jgi:alanyl-tRNA synthetase
MGFERVTAIIQGTKTFSDFSGIVSNYETDIFRSIFNEIERLSGKRYASALPSGFGPDGRLRPSTQQEEVDTAFRIIADHIRALSFAIADGIIPSNEGRGYVLRRVLRRAVRYGRTLGLHEPFFFKLVDVVAQTMGDVFPEVRAKQRAIKETIKREEEAFNRTLDKGIEEFNQMIALLEQDIPKVAPLGGWVIMPGRFVFKLYDTYGFPFDLTELMARERGFTVDKDGFDRLMEEQRARARSAQKKQIVELSEIETKDPTRFVGYDDLEAVSKVEEVASLRDKTAVVLAVSPCYPEMGGQVGDTGMFETSDTAIARFFRIADTRKLGGTWIHLIEDELAPNPGSTVIVRVDVDRRHAIERHHTVTHLLHWALHEVVSREASQKGSYVGPDKLTFDFSSAALTKQQVRDVEKLVNEKITENAPVYYVPDVPYSEAKKRSDIQQFFGEKYGDTVRVLQIGGSPNALNGYSMELCGGTHVRSTAEIGPFRIVKEEAIAAGTRRIEAVAGDAAREWAKQEAERQQEKFEALARKKPDIEPLPAFQDHAATAEMLQQIDARAAHLEKVDADVREWEKKTSKAAEADLKSRAAQIANDLAQSHADKNFCIAEVPDADGKLLQAVVDALKSKFKGPIFLAGTRDGSVALVAYVPAVLTAKLQANKLIQQIAPIVGGKGGGRPESARGAGKDASKVSEALAKARELLS